mmetsp:Transcript_4038/g.3373  ORF Transcript_4038/g.3373 Transcript_4038/m.3373 type:complete len:81 (-) Transcript_4038:26-268(-)
MSQLKSMKGSKFLVTLDHHFLTTEVLISPVNNLSIMEECPSLYLSQNSTADLQLFASGSLGMGIPLAKSNVLFKFILLIL